MARQKKQDHDDLLDGDFLDDKDFAERNFRPDEERDHSYEFRDDVVDVTLPEPKAKEKEKEPKLEIEIASDVPEKDRGRWVADDQKDGEPDFPNEDEIKNYSKDVQARISKMTARTHAERRRADDMQRQLSEAAKLADSLIKRNNELSELIESGEKVLVTEHKGRLEASLAAAKTAYREAHEAGDTNGMVAAQEAIAKAAAAIDRVSTHRPQPMPRFQQTEYDQVFKQPAQPVVDETTRRWKEENTWFGKDTVMTAFAMGVHTDLVNKGTKPEDQSYWRTLNDEMHKRFPERFRPQSQNNGQSYDRPRRTETIVAPAQRTGDNAPRKVVLTETQVKLAKTLGLTLEQYAAQVDREERQRRG